jgi:hypothetical protein
MNIHSLSLFSIADEARELKRIREIPDNVNITETATNNKSSDEEELPRNMNSRAPVNDSLSEDNSDDD